jgi:Mg-chelatase subunit ChlD
MNPILILAAAALLPGPPGICDVTPAAATPAPAAVAERPLVQLAICLDTSGSMSGLIEAAKQKLWAIVNDLALAQPTPRLEVALLTYGNDGHDAAIGWVNVETPFTEDLDLVSQRLFVLSTNGGTELVGRVLSAAGELAWKPGDDTLTLVVVAGNESADQDQEKPFRDVCRALIARGIMVNSVYCGPEQDEIAPAWREVALLADGKFASIDQNEGTIVIATPYDARLAELSTAVNETYIPLGAEGQWGAQNQTAQDLNAASLNSAAAAARCGTKLSGCYVAKWDLVDRCKEEGFDWASISEADLPEAMRPMKQAERVAYVEAKAKQRAEIQHEVGELSRQRSAFIESAMRTQGLDDAKSFDRAIRVAIRAQAEGKGLHFKADE